MAITDNAARSGNSRINSVPSFDKSHRPEILPFRCALMKIIHPLQNSTCSIYSPGKSLVNNPIDGGHIVPENLAIPGFKMDSR